MTPPSLGLAVYAASLSLGILLVLLWSAWPVLGHWLRRKREERRRRRGRKLFERVKKLPEWQAVQEDHDRLRRELATAESVRKLIVEELNEQCEEVDDLKEKLKKQAAALGKGTKPGESSADMGVCKRCLGFQLKHDWQAHLCVCEDNPGRRVVDAHVAELAVQRADRLEEELHTAARLARQLGKYPEHF